MGVRRGSSSPWAVVGPPVGTELAAPFLVALWGCRHLVSPEGGLLQLSSRFIFGGGVTVRACRTSTSLEVQDMASKWQVAVVLFIGFVFVPASAAAPSFQGLGDLAGGPYYSRALAISDDGVTVVGHSRSATSQTGHNNNEAFMWTEATGMAGLGDLPGGEFGSNAQGISADGTVIVGVGGSEWGSEAFRWTAGTGMIGLGDLAGGAFGSGAHSTSANGAVVVGSGRSDGGAFEAFRWSETTGMVGLGDLAGGGFLSYALSTSADGSAIVGQGLSASGYEAFAWTHFGMVGLGDLPGGNFQSNASDINTDGSVVVGHSVSDRGQEAFLWTTAEGMIGLGDLAGGEFLSLANAVTDDGSVVIGMGTSESGSEAFIWDATHGTTPLASYLTGLGLDLTDWHLIEATDITPDGLGIVGYGLNPDGNEEAWIATIPEPATMTLMGLGMAGMLLAAKRKIRSM